MGSRYKHKTETLAHMIEAAFDFALGAAPYGWVEMDNGPIGVTYYKVLIDGYDKYPCGSHILCIDRLDFIKKI